MVRVNADVRSDLERSLDDRACVELGVLQQCARRRLRVDATGSDRE
jgi:hypothetical protein